MTKIEFLDTLRAERARIETALGKQTEAQLIHRAAPDQWSLKDTLAHLTYWEQYMLERVQRALLGETPRWVTDEEETENAHVFERNKERPLARVLADMRRSLADVLEQVESMSDPDLTDPNRFAWMKGKPLWSYIANEAYGEHYHDHLQQLLEPGS